MSGSDKIDLLALALRDQQGKLPRRFYKEAAAKADGEGFALTLDSRPARTPARAPLVVPSRALMEAIAAEWNAQVDVIDPASMPLTRLVNTAIDGAEHGDAIAAEIVRYGGSDLLLYRAGEPEGLVREEFAAWNPIVDWARDELGARFMLGEGVMFVLQADHVETALKEAVDRAGGSARIAHLRLAAMHVLTTLTGSAVLALAVALKRLDASEAWRAAHVGEDFQMRVWGRDEEAMQRRAKRWSEAQAAAQILELTARARSFQAEAYPAFLR